MSDYLMEPLSDGVAVTVEVMGGLLVYAVGPQLVLRTDEQGIAARVDPAMARALVRALLPLCPEPPGDLGADYTPYMRDRTLVDAALKVLGPVFSIDEESDPDPEPF